MSAGGAATGGAAEAAGSSGKPVVSTLTFLMFLYCFFCNTQQKRKKRSKMNQRKSLMMIWDSDYLTNFNFYTIVETFLVEDYHQYKVSTK